MRMWIDEARRDDQVGGIDNLLRALGDFANFDDLAVGDRNVCAPRGSVGTINHCAVSDQ